MCLISFLTLKSIKDNLVPLDIDASNVPRPPCHGVYICGGPHLGPTQVPLGRHHETVLSIKSVGIVGSLLGVFSIQSLCSENLLQMEDLVPMDQGQGSSTNPPVPSTLLKGSHGILVTLTSVPVTLFQSQWDLSFVIPHTVLAIGPVVSCCYLVIGVTPPQD